MTAMPPTIGHKALIDYACLLASHVEVVICTQPGEPFVEGRVAALRQAFQGKRVTINHKHRKLPQEPEGFPGFWEMWAGFLYEYGFQNGDFLVASEDYGVRLAQEVRGVFIPFDLDRTIVKAKATLVRENPHLHFKQILPEFRPWLKRKVTIFGAESTGKTTLAKDLEKAIPYAKFYPEWARPYLETTGPDLNIEKMTDIWDGQSTLQHFAENNTDELLSVLDTDLFSTVGYWRMWDKGSYPRELEADALNTKSELYIVTPSNIPFEADPLRYGGDKRESDDQYWIDILAEFGVDYIVLDSADRKERVDQAFEEIMKVMVSRENNPLAFQRAGQ